MRKSSGSEIPDTAPYVEWLAIVGSIVVAVLLCAVLFSNGVLTGGSARRGRKRLCLSSRSVARWQLWPFRSEMPAENGGGHVQEQSTREG